MEPAHSPPTWLALCACTLLTLPCWVLQSIGAGRGQATYERVRRAYGACGSQPSQVSDRGERKQSRSPGLSGTPGSARSPNTMLVILMSDLTRPEVHSEGPTTAVGRRHKRRIRTGRSVSRGAKQKRKENGLQGRCIVHQKEASFKRCSRIAGGRVIRTDIRVVPV